MIPILNSLCIISVWAFQIYHTFLNPPAQYNIYKNLHELYHLLHQVYKPAFPYLCSFRFIPINAETQLIHFNQLQSTQLGEYITVDTESSRFKKGVDDGILVMRGWSVHGQETLDWACSALHMASRWSSGLYLPNTPHCH